MSETDYSPDIVRDYTTTITILEHLQDAIFILRPNGTIEYANKVALDLLNLELPVAVGHNLNDFLMTDVNIAKLSEEDSEDTFLENIYRGVFNEFETSLVHQEHATSVVISFGLIRNMTGTVDYIIASAKNITVQKNLEKELRQQQLISLSRDRYRELGELAINMVHNLSQPITSIQLMVDLLRKEVASGKFNEQQVGKKFERISGLLNEMTQSIASVRNFAFLTEDESWKAVDVNQALNSALEQIAYELKDNNVTVHRSGAQKLPAVLANPFHLQQVFVSLIRFMENNLPEEDHKAIGEEKSIHLKIKNKQNHWIEVHLYSEREINVSHFDQDLISSHLDLTVVQIMISALGGDFKAGVPDGNSYQFLLRIPVDQSGERDQLRNLIELMYQ